MRRSLYQSEAELRQSQLRHLRSLAIIYLTFSLAVVKFILVLIGHKITFFGLVYFYDTPSSEWRTAYAHKCHFFFRGCERNITKFIPGVAAHQRTQGSRTFGLQYVSFTIYAIWYVNGRSRGKRKYLSVNPCTKQR